MNEPKQFQLATAAVAFNALKPKAAGSRRFLVADEVGLGKTVVAREVVRMFSEAKKHVGLRVLYVCSNLTIARQNSGRLLPGSGEVLQADRLTTVWQELRPVPKGGVQLLTITPETSIPLRRGRPSMGRGEERAIVQHLVEKRWWGAGRRVLKEYYQGMVGSKQWKKLRRIVKRRHRSFPKPLSDAFAQMLPRQTPEGVFSDDKPSKYHVVSRLRSALAAAALRQFAPDLIIFDEFQKFRDLLLETKISEWDRVTPLLRGENWPRPPGILLLSATPYRLYARTSEDPGGKIHHNEFFQVLQYLLGGSSGAQRNAVKSVKDRFERFRTELQATHRDEVAILAARDALQAVLRPVMARTERNNGADSSDRIAPKIFKTDPAPQDMQVFRGLAAGLRPEDRHWAVDLWKSIPLPLQMLGPNYVVWKRAVNLKPEKPVAFTKTQRDSFRVIDPWPHPWLRSLRAAPDSISAPALSMNRLSLPWLPPSVPWWPLKGSWQSVDVPSSSKLLVFSRYRALPLALAGLLSYDLESHWLRGQTKYDRLLKKSAPLKVSASSRAVLALFLPSPTLMEATDPIRAIREGKASVQADMRLQVLRCLRDLGFTIKTKDSCRPYSSLLAQLESRDAARWDSWVTTAIHEWPLRDGSEMTLRNLLEDWPADDRDWFTTAEVDLLTRHALGNPGIVVGRAYQRAFGKIIVEDDTGQLSALLRLCWRGFQRYFNRRLFARILRRRGFSYADALIQAMVDGNLEAVLDEHWSGPGSLGRTDNIRSLQELEESLGLMTGRAEVHEGKKRRFTLRCHAAMPFLEAKLPEEGGKRLRTESLRLAFNSPFWPHVLITTSVGQEGLDFHRWCQEVLHWDLCNSPVELEQREGRIQRFGSLSVRRAVAARLGAAAWEKVKSGEGPWSALVVLAEKQFSDKSGLSPWWIFEGAKIQPWFLSLSQSRLSERIKGLQHERGLYRLAMGQPNQEEFIKSLGLQPDEAQRYLLRLSPFLESESDFPDTHVDAK